MHEGGVLVTEDWTVQVLTSGHQAHADDWEAIARALDGVLAAVASAAHRGGLVPEQTLDWRDETGGQQRPETGLLGLVLERRERHDDGDLVTGAASVGDLRAQAPNGTWIAAVSWELGARSGQGSVRTRFDAKSVGPLAQQSPTWLAALLSEVALAVGAIQGQITNRSLSRALARRGASLAVGALTLLPEGLPPDTEVPPGFTLIPTTPHYPNGAVLAADLQPVAETPDTVADALADLDRRIEPRQQNHTQRR
jgi:hypothetical protein